MASRAAWAAHFGLARTPFGKAIAAGDLFARQAHAQATARISFCIDQILLGVITGDVGAGKTVAVRAAVAGLDPTRHQVGDVELAGVLAAAVGGEVQQQSPGVAVAGDRVGAGTALADQPAGEERLQRRGERGHRGPPGARRAAASSISSGTASRYQ